MRYGNNSNVAITGIDETGGALKGGVIEFDVDFGTDLISNGTMLIYDSSNTTWSVTFDGNVHGAFATMSNVTGTFGGTDTVTGAIGGAFTGTTTTPDFVSGFSLKSGSSFVQGMSLLDNENCFTCTP